MLRRLRSFSLIAVCVTAVVMLCAHALTSQSTAQESPASENPQSSQTAKTPPKSKSSETAAQQPPELPTEPDPAALKLLAEARRKLRENLFQAKVVHTLHFGLDNTIRSESRFAQGPNLKCRLDLKLEIGGTTGRMTQVCDGEILWTQQQIGEQIRVARRDVRQILNAAKTMTPLPENLVRIELGLGGIGGLLANIERAVTFAAPQKVTVGGEELMVIRGGMSRQMQQSIAGDPLAKQRGALNLFPFVTEIYFDSNGFPRRLRYFNRPDGKTLSPMLTLDFEDYKLFAENEVPAGLFDYTPPENVFQKETTQDYINLMKAPPPPDKPQTKLPGQ